MEEKRPRGRPATGVTPKRNIRVGDVWDQAEEIAKQASGETMTALVTRLLHGYVREHRQDGDG
jgi:hypothetical protein